MDFTGYTPSDAHAVLSDVTTLRQAERSAAEAHFDALMASRARRFAELATLARCNSAIDIALDDAPVAFLRSQQWARAPLAWCTGLV